MRPTSDYSSGFLSAVLKGMLEHTAAGGTGMRRTPLVYDGIHRFCPNYTYQVKVLDKHLNSDLLTYGSLGTSTRCAYSALRYIPASLSRPSDVVQ